MRMPTCRRAAGVRSVPARGRLCARVLGQALCVSVRVSAGPLAAVLAVGWHAERQGGFYYQKAATATKNRS